MRIAHLKIEIIGFGQIINCQPPADCIKTIGKVLETGSDSRVAENFFTFTSANYLAQLAGG
jgi:hypothetical protein